MLAERDVFVGIREDRLDIIDDRLGDGQGFGSGLYELERLVDLLVGLERCLGLQIA